MTSGPGLSACRWERRPRPTWSETCWLRRSVSASILLSQCRRDGCSPLPTTISCCARSNKIDDHFVLQRPDGAAEGLQHAAKRIAGGDVDRAVRGIWCPYVKLAHQVQASIQWPFDTLAPEAKVEKHVSIGIDGVEGIGQRSCLTIGVAR